MEDQPKKQAWWKQVVGIALAVAVMKLLADTLNESHTPILVLLRFLVFWGFVVFILWVIARGIYRRITKKGPVA